MENDMTLDQAIQHLEIDVLPNHCNGNEACYRQHNQLYEWLKELRERRAKEGVRYDDGKDRNIGIAEGDRLCLYYDKPFTDGKGRVTGFGYYHCPIDAMADSIEELQSNGMGGNLKDVSTDDLRLYFTRLRDVLNKNDLEKYKAFCRQWSALFGTKEPNCEEVWEISWRKLQYNKTDCYPKVRREAKKWLLEHGYSLNIGGAE